MNPEHVELMRRRSEEINPWRAAHPDVRLDLRGADLRDLDLGVADLTGADLREAILKRASLRGARLSRADLGQAILFGADLWGAQLQAANLTKADLSWASLFNANLSVANLIEANLTGTDLNRATLREVDFAGARSDGTLYCSLDLSEVLNLEGVKHAGPSSLGTDTLIKSKGNLPEVFLRGCGLSDWEIQAAKLHDPQLARDGVNRLLYDIADLRSGSPIQVSPLFISYSHCDAAFVDELERKLSNHGIRFWRDVHDLTAGRLETQIDRAIRLNPTAVLVLSQHSVESDWVEYEAAKARDLEKELKRDVLCPIALDASWKTCGWPGPLRKQIEDYHILDFSRWEDAGSLEAQFSKLIDGLQLFYGPRR